MWQVAAGVIQIIYLLLKNKFEKDAEKKKQMEELHVEAKEAIKSRDASRINSVVGRLRNS
jgi:hypothetical protein